MTGTGHVRRECVHGVVQSQCRCTGPHQVEVVPCRPSCERDDEGRATVRIRGVWLVKKHEHLGGHVQVIVQLVDGSYRVAVSHKNPGDNLISHYAGASGVATWPVYEVGADEQRV